MRKSIGCPLVLLVESSYQRRGVVNSLVQIFAAFQGTQHLSSVKTEESCDQVQEESCNQVQEESCNQVQVQVWSHDAPHGCITTNLTCVPSNSLRFNPHGCHRRGSGKRTATYSCVPAGEKYRFQ